MSDREYAQWLKWDRIAVWPQVIGHGIACVVLVYVWLMLPALE